MSAGSIVSSVFIVLGLGVEVLACIGLVTMRTTMQRLHYVAPAACVAPWLFGIAVTTGTHATPSQAGKALIIAGCMSLFSGVVSHETGCAAVARLAADP